MARRKTRIGSFQSCMKKKLKGRRGPATQKRFGVAARSCAIGRKRRKRSYAGPRGITRRTKSRFGMGSWG